MFDSLSPYIGLPLNAEAIRRYPDAAEVGYIVTRPDYYGPNIHINLFVRIGEDWRITAFDGDKCYSYSRGLYNRSSSVHERAFTQRDIAFFTRFVKGLTQTKTR